MDSITNTQTLTKFLRSKDAPISDIILVINKTLESQYDFLLPNSQHFIFDLLCDRFNDSGKLDWKLNPSIWKLFQRLWVDLSHNKLQRDKSFRKVKIVEVLTAIFKNFYQGDEQLFHELYCGMYIVVNEFFIEVDESTCLNFLKNYTNIFQLELNSELFENWTNLSEKIYKLYLNDINYVQSKKNSQRFNNDVLPILLTTIQNLDGLATVKLVLQKIIKESINILTIEELIKSERLLTTCILLLYKIIIEVNIKDVERCEKLFIAIINIPKYCQLSNKLIEILKHLNKPLSSAFFETIYESNLSLENWELIGNIFNLDVNLAVAKTPVLLSKISNFANFKILPNIIQSYIRAREFYEFIIDIWSVHIINSKSSLWKSSEVINLISDAINDLSSNQMIKVIEHTSTNTEYYPILLSLVKGLNHCSTTKIDAVEASIFDNVSQWPKHWELKYYLSIIYPNNITKFIDSASEYNDIYYYFFTFRRLELGNGLVDDLLLEKFKGFKKDERTLKILLSRWVIILDKFNIDIFDELVNLDYETLEKILQENDYIFEQTRFIKSFIAKLPSSKYSLIKSIPIQCFDKHSKSTIINSSVDNDSGYDIISHLVPSYTSNIETDAIKLINFTNAKNYQIFEKIWSYKLSEQGKFINDVLSYLVKNLHNTIVIDIVLKEPLDNDNYHQLKKKYLKYLTKQLSQDLPIDEVVKCLTSFKQEPVPSNIINKLSGLNSPQVNKLLFKSMTRLANYYHILSIYMILEVDDNDLIDYLKNVADIETLVKYVIVSFETDKSLRYIDLINCIMKVYKSQWLITSFISIILSNLSHFHLSWGQILQIIKRELSDKFFNQYSIELTVDLITKISQTAMEEQLYILSTQVLSHILLFHRYRLTSRHHIINSVLTTLLMPLSSKNSLHDSKLAAMAYARLLSNLCEPPVTISSNLSTNASIIKKNLRNYVPMLIINYIQISLKFNFDKLVNDELVLGIYTVFDVLSQRELDMTNNYLDHQGKVLYKNLYQDYKSHGKWVQ